MSGINKIDLRNIDLNLLLVFDLLMAEQSVTRAAEKLHLSQGAVSASLARLRVMFDDPLFQRSRSGMIPTAKALSIAPSIGRSLASVANVVFEDIEFDPETSDRTFHLAMSDDLEVALLPRLLNLRRKNGWKINFAVHQTNARLWRRAFDEQSADLVVCRTPEQLPAEFQSQTLFVSTFRCLFSAELLNIGLPLTFEDFAEADHLRISYDGQRGVLDGIFETKNLERKAVASVSHFASAATLLKTAPLIATMPAHAAYALARTADLTIDKPPLRMPNFNISNIWRSSLDHNPATTWLREVIGSVIPAHDRYEWQSE